MAATLRRLSRRAVAGGLRREMLAAGERFLTKPVPISQMIRTVRELLDSGLCRKSKA